MMRAETATNHDGFGLQQELLVQLRAAGHEVVDFSANDRLWLMFLTVPLVGPLMAWIGFSWLSTSTATIGVVMLFCSGGIFYLIFDDIAPRAHLKHHDFPAIGAVSGFLLGLVGTMFIH